MNKIYLTFLITLLITLQFGCLASRREVDDKVQELNADIQKNDRQIKKEISAISKDLDGLKSNLDEKVQKLNADIKENDNQLENETAVIKNEVEGLKSSLTDQVQKLDTDIQENDNQLENETTAIKKEFEGLKSSLTGQVQKLDTDIQENDNQLENETTAIKKEFEGLKSNLSDQIQELNTVIQEKSSQIDNKIPAITKEVDGLKTSLSGQVQELNADIQETKNKQKIYWIIAILLLVFVVAGIVFFLKYKMVYLGNILSSEFTSSVEQLKNEAIQLDTKLVQIMERQLENEKLQLGQEAKPDHSLPIKVCEEIQRMRNRMKHMDQDDQATKVFRKRLESLEEKLNDMEYEIVKLEDKPYNEGMTVRGSFISNENMKKGEEIITRVLKPQINYKNVLIQAAEVEISMGV
ncbi:MAG: DUF1640 domain-containing protein [Planctomycetes bacterium]|nr:DUF1640 domain-containing protein [Planctomycetota bacterium]